MFSHILTPLDGSPLAACVLPHVVAMARATGARITLLRVLERPGTGSGGRCQPVRLADAETGGADLPG